MACDADHAFGNQDPSFQGKSKVRPNDPKKLARLEKMLNLQAAGWNRTQIGKEVGLTRERVRQLLGNANLAERLAKRLAEEGRKIIAMRLERETLADIADATGLNKAQVASFEDLPEKPPAPIPHGTSTGYGYHKCRCKLCRAANCRRIKEIQKRQVERGMCALCHRPSPAKTWRCPICSENFRAYLSRSSARREAVLKEKL